MTGVALIVGADGFVGRRAVAHATAAGYRVVGTGQRPDSAPDTARFVPLDIRDRDGVSRLVQQTNPDLVLHLAAISQVPAVAADPKTAYEVNVIGAVHLLDALIAQRESGASDPAVVIVGSAEQYGRQTVTRPLGESDPMNPMTHYAVTKIAQETVALRAYHAHGLRVVCTRSFNHSGADQPPVFLLPGLARRAVSLPPVGGTLTMGNQSVVRDFLHVDDVVAAYFALAARGKAGKAYNVCSGVAINVRDIAEAVLSACGTKATIGTNPESVRAVDAPWLVGDPTALLADTGWQPRFTFTDLVAEVVAAARSTRTA